MDLEEGITLLNSDGFCLWVGAGVSVHLAGNANVPMWSQLITDIAGEELASTLSGSYPNKLSEIKRAIGAAQFQNALKEFILKGVSRGIVERARLHSNSRNIVPEEVNQIACLGMLANPIVNFNIEALTSSALAEAGGPYEVKYTLPTVSGAYMLTAMLSSGKYRRHILHPHGVLEHSDGCIMTSEEYDNLRGRLAFQLAIHSAFGSHLAIVGMSLNDEYLREQVGGFRNDLRKVIWFRESLPDDPRLDEWVRSNSIDVIDIGTWTNFWSIVEATLPNPTRLNLLRSWRGLFAGSWYFLHRDVDDSARGFELHNEFSRLNMAIIQAIIEEERRTA